MKQQTIHEQMHYEALVELVQQLTAQVESGQISSIVAVLIPKEEVRIRQYVGGDANILELVGAMELGKNYLMNMPAQDMEYS
jgi:hypothetical protein